MKYIARISDRAGRKLFETMPHETREAAAAEAFRARPRASSCATSQAAPIPMGEDRGGFWRASGIDIRVHAKGAE